MNLSNGAGVVRPEDLLGAAPATLPPGLPDRLLARLRADLDAPDLAYAEPPAALPGGSEAHTCTFRLAGAPPEFAGPLVLRLCRPAYGSTRLLREARVQDAVARAGYPAPRTLLVSDDGAALGGPFLVMERLPGRTVTGDGPLPDAFAEAHLALHRLDPEPVIRALGTRETPAGAVDPADTVDVFRMRAGLQLKFLPAVEWLAANRPAAPVRPAVCHGDFHPLNVLFRAGRVSGVLDWVGCTVGDPVGDVAATAVLLGVVGRHVLASPEAGRLEAAYLEAYGAHAPLEPDRLVWHRVRRCIAGLLDGADGIGIWRHPPLRRDLAAEVRRLTERWP